MPIRKHPTTFKELRTYLEQSGGVDEILVERLRDMVDIKRLTARGAKKIVDNLDLHGMGYFPRHILEPADWYRSGYQQVFVYLKDSPIGRTAEVFASDSPTKAKVYDLRDALNADPDEAAATLETIRNLLLDNGGTAA
jgi:hypothetical protein